MASVHGSLCVLSIQATSCVPLTAVPYEWLFTGNVLQGKHRSQSAWFTVNITLLLEPFISRFAKCGATAFESSPYDSLIACDQGCHQPFRRAVIPVNFGPQNTSGVIATSVPSPSTRVHSDSDLVSGLITLKSYIKTLVATVCGSSAHSGPSEDKGRVDVGRRGERRGRRT